MRKRNFKNAALYLLFLVNLTSAIKNGFDWLFAVAAILTAAVLIMDIAEAVKHGRKK